MIYENNVNIIEMVIQKVLRWFGRLEGIGEKKLVKGVYARELNGTIKGGKPLRRCLTRK